ncbi:PREDICTED: iron-sulfur cluster co-chaperone protein HscB, mitochondrial-like [Amphimedon queenslandica]|uniref:J domain-containing protein n=1 Tax=Amphimedon queenslandica TaxID=400682 RepID=A0A1X7UQT0_AMPQE|nr:PREDICTED: iron-sulfur cluster co-chaperone protein HscB, mitochondrial-like [Amphimedon queenslandica]|eukprot:XP_011404359.2 PREDICTED: iron-sulfur cluster co-chaperone protein HscB, mitochondrial-like [Amphimedon queenslandica]
MAAFRKLGEKLLLSGTSGRRLLSTRQLNCWNCNKTISVQLDEPTFTCPCEHHVILPPTTSNYFHILQCDVQFDIKPEVIKSRYHWLQRWLHPDKYALKSPLERQFAEEHSSLINKAYNTLSDHYRRGLYMLELNNVEIDEKDNLIAGGEEFLETIMNINEEIHANPSQAKLKQLMNNNEVSLNKSITVLSDCFKKNDLEGAKSALSEMKYYINIKEEILSRIQI